MNSLQRAKRAGVFHPGYKRRLLPLGAQQAASLAFPAALLLGFALIVQLFAARERKLNLGTAFFIEIQLEGDEGHPLAFDCADELVDLAAVQEQLAHSLG